MKYLCALALLLPLLSCGPGSIPAASPVHDWLNDQADGWMSGQEPDGEWTVSGGSGGSGSGSLVGGHMRFTSQSRIRGRIPQEDRPAILAAFRAEMERQILANGGAIQGKGLSGTDVAPVGWGFDYEAGNGALGGVNVDAVDAADGWFVVILTTYEIR